MATWLERAKTKYSITMGDGQVYTPLSMNANKSTEFNIAEFDFRNLDGTLVDKRRRRGTTYDLTMVFQGPDHLDIALSFQKSSYNTKPWTIQHPYYGTLGVQPITPVNYDNGNQVQGTTIVRVTVRETLNYKAITNVADASDTIATGQASTSQHFAEYFVNAVPIPSVQDVNEMRSDMSRVQFILKNISAGANDITNAYNKAQTAINSAISNVDGAINAIAFYITFPATVADSVVNRTSNLVSMMEYWFVVLNNAVKTDINSINKNLWYAEAGITMSALCLASVSNITATDYQYSTQVNNVIAQIIRTYNTYLASIDLMQTKTGNTPGSWVADPDSLISLDNMLFLTLSTLYAYQAKSKQAKYVTLTRDNNYITVAWEIYGLLSDDSTIDKLIADNNIGLNTLLQIPKGTQILYYS